MVKNVILYRIKDDIETGCRYIELDNDKIHLDYSGEPIVGNAMCSTRIKEDFEDVETWVTKDVFNRLKNADGDDTFSDVFDMIANNEHKEFEAYIMHDELEKICDYLDVDFEEADEIVYNYYNNDYFDRSIVTYIWDCHSDIAESYVYECCNVEDWICNYIDLDRMGEDIASDRGMYELYDGRIVEYAN